MTKSLSLAATVAAGWLALAAPAAQAAPLFGQLGASLGIRTSLGFLLDEGSTVTITGGAITSRDGDMSPVPVGTRLTSITPTTLLLDEGVTLAFTVGTGAGFGRFSGTAIAAELIGTPAIDEDRTVRLLFVGTFDPAGPLSSFDVSDASLLLNFVQTAGVGATVSASLVLDTPPVGVPAPAGLALFGLGLMLMGTVRARRAG